MPIREKELVAWLTQRLAPQRSDVQLGVGDDMAILSPSANVVAVTTDMLLDGVHFDTSSQNYEAVGQKAIACSLSDCAGMACKPVAATVSLALPNTIELNDVKSLYEGMIRMADEFNCAIVGGDTTVWPGKLAIDVAMLAEPANTRGPIRRSTAKPGDAVFVTGPLGGSYLGKHLTFTPRLSLAAQLAADEGVHALMDISDGLSLDLHRLASASKLAAELDAKQLVAIISDDAYRAAIDDDRAPLLHALSDGEDFELLVTGDAALADRHADLTRVGQIVEPASNVGELWLIDSRGRQPLEPAGYQHG